LERNFTIEYDEKDHSSTINIQLFAKGAYSKDFLLGEAHLNLGEIDPPKVKWNEKNTTHDKKKEQNLQDIVSAACASVKNIFKDETGKTDQEKLLHSKEKENPWFKSNPRELPLKNANGDKIGHFTLRIRREIKLFGMLNIDMKEIDLDPSENEDNRPIKCVFKLASDVFETPSVNGKEGKYVWKSCNIKFPVDEKNHVYDCFIEVYQDTPLETATSFTNPSTIQEEVKDNSSPTTSEENYNPKTATIAKTIIKSPLINGKLLGQARIPLYDTRSSFKIPLPIYRQDEKQIGLIQLNAKLDVTGKSNPIHA